jgi:integrase
VKPESGGGLLLLRHVTPLQRRDVVYFCSGAYRSHITGGCYHASVIQRQILKPAGEKVGISGIGWHTFRHSYRSFLDETGAPIGVQQKLMRHSNVATTMNVYGNASLRAKQQANSKVVEMLITRNLPQMEQQRVAV